jgi:hypothetical protein
MQTRFDCVCFENDNCNISSPNKDSADVVINLQSLPTLIRDTKENGE